MKPQYIHVTHDGSKFYYCNKKMTTFHREDGPAIEDSDGSKYWYCNNILHREDGPAIEYSDGSKEWWVDGCELTEDQFLKRMQPPASCAGRIVEIDGRKYKLTEV